MQLVGAFELVQRRSVLAGIEELNSLDAEGARGGDTAPLRATALRVCGSSCPQARRGNKPDNENCAQDQRHE